MRNQFVWNFFGTHFCGFCLNPHKLVTQNFFKISHPQKLVPKKIFFSKLNMQVNLAKPLMLVNCWKT